MHKKFAALGVMLLRVVVGLRDTRVDPECSRLSSRVKKNSILYLREREREKGREKGRKKVALFPHFA